jgi:hypothetical protein
VTASGELEVCAETRAQLVRRLGSLRRGHAVQRVLSEAGTARPVELDGDGKRQLLAELSFWLDNPGPGGFPDDARALYRALAGELEPVADGDVPVLGS